MTTPMTNELEQIFADLAASRARITACHERIRTATFTATDRRRSVRATADGSGTLTALKFLGNAYRTMAPAELANVIVDTVRAAREEALEEVVELFGDVLPGGLPVRDMVEGRFDPEAFMTGETERLRSIIDAFPAGDSGEQL